MKSRRTNQIRGMTLMETVIAIGVIGFSVPLILAGTNASLSDRSNAEADTRSAWIAKDLEQQVNALWASPRQNSYLPASLTLDFPVNGTESAPWVFIYNKQGTFLGQGSIGNLGTGATSQDAYYLVSLHTTAYTPANLLPPPTAGNSRLSRVFIKVEYPAKARLGRRQANLFSSIKTQQNL